MPEGPSIVILKEETVAFSGRQVHEVSGNSKLDIRRMEGERLIKILSWGKHYLLCFKDFTLRIHFLLFGSYRINEKKESPARLSLYFDHGELHFYACSLKFLEGDINTHYDWSTDVMNPRWNSSAALRKLNQHPDRMICDQLLDQDIFAGVGNIIKNEVLYRVKVHPKALTVHIPVARKKEIIKQAVIYSFEFLEWKKAYVLKKHWLAHTKKTCKRCKVTLTKQITGVKKRRSFYCTNCQKLYS